MLAQGRRVAAYGGRGRFELEGRSHHAERADAGVIYLCTMPRASACGLEGAVDGVDGARGYVGSP